ncbi:polyamine ABC transporter substrate-binding protein [Labrys wisconsinensis]|uniref:Putrescine-binding periplasmic protein n=1 Tax=Labrys wisconsinensis TaxID=425677 RepID=A0ABU0JM25_9HYPH|nr:polyamine ABC transporter substrate-binding protein [Labrys wisconsinensis]MDQ0475346.1 putrescine transport system substrate-binding protein [Labrys wisconsinensis]
MIPVSKRLSLCCAAAVAGLLAASAARADEEKVLHVYNWADYIGETTLADFEKETGIKVVYDTYDASETVDAKMMAGKSGYDVVLHSGSFLPRLIKAGAFQKLDKAKLTNWGNLDPHTLGIIATYDPGNQYGVPYMWGTVGITYNLDMVKERIKDAPLDSLDMLFNPDYAGKLRDCGISVLDSPTDIMPMALAYFGKKQDTEDPADYQVVVDAFAKVHDAIKTFDSENYLNALPNKELCMAFTWSGDYATAMTRAKEAGVDLHLQYVVPKTGAPAWFDAWVIPADAPHPQNAQLFLNYMLRPEVIAAATNTTHYANSIPASNKLVDPAILNDPAVYPDAAVQARIWAKVSATQSGQREFTRAWSRIRTGQ